MNAEGQSYETSPQFSAYSSRPKVGPDGYVDAAISMADRCELPENEVSEFCDKSRSGRMSWESLEEVIKKTFEEAAQLIAHDSTKCQHGSNMQSKPSKHPRSETTSIQTSPATRCDKAAKDIQVPRRPQHHDEYWSVSPKAWAKLSETRRGVLSHVGRINETSDGQEAPGGECKKCDESGSDCMIYCERTLGTHHPLGGVSACSREEAQSRLQWRKAELGQKDKTAMRVAGWNWVATVF
ncbi:hypothetical protein Q7P37_009829 [Cladosporium fusiforme]